MKKKIQCHGFWLATSGLGKHHQKAEAFTLKPPLTFDELITGLKKVLPLNNQIIPNAKICKIFFDQGYRSMHHAICVTKLTTHQLQNSKLWAPTDDVLALMAPLDFPERRLDRICFDPVLKENFIQFKSNIYPRIIAGQVLSLFILSKQTEFKIPVDDLFNLTITQLRFMGGAGAVFDVALRNNVDLQTTQSSQVFEVIKIDEWVGRSRILTTLGMKIAWPLI
jgi:hypothetical protein